MGKRETKRGEKSRKRKNTNSHPRHFVALGIKSVEGPTTAVCPLTLAYSLKEVNATLSYATGANPQPRILQRAVGETYPNVSSVLSLASNKSGMLRVMSWVATPEWLFHLTNSQPARQRQQNQRSKAAATHARRCSHCACHAARQQ